MADTAPEFETIDALGFSGQYAGTVGTTPVQVPAVAGNPISDALIRCTSSNTPVTKNLLWSLDNVTYHVLSPGEFVGWTFKKLIGTSNEIKQVWIKGSVAGVLYEILANTED